MTKYIDPKLSQEALETYQGYSLQVFTSGRIKRCFHSSHIERIEYSAHKVKNSWTAYRRQCDRSALAKPKDYQFKEALLQKHPNCRFYRSHQKVDINATTDNANVLVLIEKKHLHVLFAELQHRYQKVLWGKEVQLNKTWITLRDI